MRPSRTPRPRRAFLTAVTGAAATTAGCALLPEEQEPIEASAGRPASLPDAAVSERGYEETLSTETTVTVSITVDLSGDVQISNTREVIATVFRRGYAAEDGRRFGVVTAPAVAVIEQPEVVRDPVAAVSAARAVELATGASVSSVSDWRSASTRTVLGTEAESETATATADDADVDLERARVRADGDAVTAIAVAPAGVESDPPFGEVTRDA
ncbi:MULTISPECIES: DUF6517 family protein [unclassified Halorubrum]|uniref:DUF6517 family protein n=1 Tax=unclassified Halorubrum TaxID=2642239 RepID=UPI000B989D0B|nr:MULTISPECIES: DUF6517 family protein [unclassified Halorubrum]OYR41164.1 hypothetical protein DJ81_13000 [Halorubrum sp. Hd13]OYR46935.1 hypothetical protein DJ75_05290 [Halorubrum sp. Eb13]OYR47158.1 hypothetical protein DJ74_13470 [Halorubrum sp. Ea8]